MSLDGQWWIWNYRAANGSSYPEGEKKELASTIPWSKECRVGLRMNLQFSSLKTLRVEGLEILDKEAIVCLGESSIEEDEEKEEEEDSCTEGSRSLENVRVC